MQRLGGEVSELGDEKGRWMFQRNFKPVRIQTADAQGFDRQFALFRVLQSIEDIGIGCAGRWRHQAPECEDKIVRGECVAI